jgi:hypothetical protein
MPTQNNRKGMAPRSAPEKPAKPALAPKAENGKSEFPEFSFMTAIKNWRWLAFPGIVSFIAFWALALVPISIDISGYPITPKSMMESAAKKALVDQFGNSATSRVQQSRVLIAWADGLARGSKNANVLTTENYAAFMKQVQLAVKEARNDLAIYHDLLEDQSSGKSHIVGGGV